MSKIKANFSLVMTSLSRSTLLVCLLLSLLFLLLFLVLIQFEPGGDWAGVLRPSTRSFLTGGNPYNEPAFLSPPWFFLVLAPPALLPPAHGSALFALIGAAGYLAAFYRLKINRIALLFLVATPGFLAALFNPNFDWAVALGFTLPPQIGLFFVLAKPQIGAPLVIFWLVDAWRSGGYREVIRIFLPVAIAYGVSFVFYGPWVLHMGGAVSSLSNTANVWPWGLLIGSILLSLSLRYRKAGLALAAGPFFSPYLAAYSWLPAIVGLSPYTIEIIVACLAYWPAWIVSNFY